MAEREDEAEVSPESLAWADSCLINFPDESDNSNWENFRDALTEIIDIHPDMFVPSSSGTTSVPSREEDMTESDSIELEANSNNSSSEEQVSEIISLLTFESDSSKNSLLESMAENKTLEPVDDPVPPTDLEGAEMIEDGESLSFQVFKDDFISTSSQDNAHVFDVSEDPVKVTPQEIFKVWDLGVVGDDYEDDGLVLQLKKALNESSTVKPLNDEQVVVEQSGIDDLIAGISDLSLAETFPSER